MNNGDMKNGIIDENQYEKALKTGTILHII